MHFSQLTLLFSCRHSLLLFTFHGFCWWRLTGSNRRPPACKAGALPAELNPPLNFDSLPAPRLLVGLVGLEPTTPALSTQCSNQLSYRPKMQPVARSLQHVAKSNPLQATRYTLLAYKQPMSVGTQSSGFSRKEVIQPHLPIRLPCYDFTPVMNLTVVGAPLAVRRPASGETHSHGVTGGVYKTRERIHRDMLIRDY